MDHTDQEDIKSCNNIEHTVQGDMDHTDQGALGSQGNHLCVLR